MFLAVPGSDVDPLGLNSLTLGDDDLKYAVIRFCRYRVWIGGIRQTEASVKGAISPLYPFITFLLVFCLGLLFAPYGQHAILHADIDFLGLYSGKICQKDKFIRFLL